MYVNLNGQKLYYEQAGTGKPVLLLHGWGVSGEVFKPLFFRLARSRQVRVMDFPGFGLSEPPPSDWGTSEYAALVKAFLDNWGCGPVDILAHSFGARVALRLSHGNADNVKRLILAGAAGIRSEKKIPPGKRLLQNIAKTAGKFGSPGVWLKTKIYGFIGSADYASAGKMRPVFVRVVNENLEPLLPKIFCETLLIWGEKDTETLLEDGRKMKAGLPNSRLEIIKDAGHYSFIDAPEVFCGLVETFLQLPV